MPRPIRRAQQAVSTTKRRYICAGVLTAATLVLPAQAAHAASPGAYWQFDEPSGDIVTDSSANGNDGTVSGAQRTAGRFGGALSFDGGINTKVLVPRSASLEPQKITVEAWVRGTNPGNFKYIVAKGARACEVGSYGLYTGPDGGLKFYVSAGNSAAGNLVASPDAGTSVWDGEWHHVAGTYDGQTARLYVGGNQIGSGTPGPLAIAYPLPDNNDAYLGFFNDNLRCSQILGFKGDIDEPRIWDRALDPAEIAASSSMGDGGGRQLAIDGATEDAVIYTSETDARSNVTLAIESASGTERIREVHIYGPVAAAAALATCSSDQTNIVDGKCDVQLSNGDRTARLSINRTAPPAAARVKLFVTLSSGRTLLVTSAP